ncbi:MAG: elongation factor P 5-aminopentanone reductase [Lachnospiraceae bacterium]
MTTAALITGASRGIGKACALELAESFDTIIINSFHNKDGLSETKKQIEACGTNCLTYMGNIGDYDFVKKMITDIKNQNITIDLLVNNAAISYVGLLTDMSIDDWNQIIQTNLTSVFNCCKEVVPQMVSNKKGHIINISSMWGINGASCEVAYSTTKGGLNAFTQGLAKELAPSNIRVNAIACGTINTSMNACFSEEEIKQLENDIPVGRMGTCKEVAQMVKLIYESPLYLTGEIIKFDGAYL